MDIGILIGVLAIILSIIFFYSDVQKKLKYLIERESGTLTYPQAKDLADLYLDAIQRELNLAISGFFQKKFEKCIKNNDVESIKRFINHNTTQAILKTRNKMSNFQIIGGQSYREFIEKNSPIETGNISEAKQKALDILLSANESTDINSTKSAVLNCVAEAGERAAVKLKEELSKRYS